MDDQCIGAGISASVVQIRLHAKVKDPYCVVGIF
jgi:hypothetical protein